MPGETVTKTEPNTTQQQDQESQPATSSSSASTTEESQAQSSNEQQKPKSIASFTKEIGIIEPPADLKGIVDRTAEFVRKNGGAFEQEIINRNRNNIKFAFLQAENPYHAYYQAKLRGEEIRSDSSAQPPAPVAPVQVKQEESQEAAAPKVLSLEEKLQQLHLGAKMPDTDTAQPPAPDQFTVKPPTTFSAVDIDIIKLTAQFVARNGRSFLTSLSAKEQNNSQYDFLKPTHPLFTLFQQYVAAYAQIILAPNKVVQDLKEDLADPRRIIQRALQRKKYEDQQQEKIKKEQQAGEEERIAMALIDWHDFVVVETISFTESEYAYLPNPSQNIEEMVAMLQAQAISQENTRQATAAAANAAANAANDQDVDMDMDSDNIDEKERENAEASAAAEAKRLLEASRRSEQAEKSVKYQKCPVCNQLIPIEDISEHMRIELLDPKWKEQKQSIADRQRESSLAENQSISANLSRLARKRQDVFIDTDDEETKRKKDEEEKWNNAVIWDGHAASARTTQQAQVAAALKPPTIPAPPKPSSTPILATPSAIPPRPAIPGFNPNNMPAANNLSAARPPQPPPPMAPKPSAPILPRPGTLPGIPGMPSAPGVPGLSGLSGLPHSAGMSGLAGLNALNRPAAPGMAAALLNLNQPAVDDDSEEPASKRARTDAEQLIPEEKFLELHKSKGPIKISVQVPQDASKAEWKFNGQTLDLTFSLTDTVGNLKAKLTEMLGIPGAKQKLHVKNASFLNKDTATFAFYNVAPPAAAVELGLKERGGRRK